MQKQKHLTNARRDELVGSHDVTLQLFQRCLPQPGEGGRHRQNGVEEARKNPQDPSSFAQARCPRLSRHPPRSPKSVQDVQDVQDLSSRRTRKSRDLARKLVTIRGNAHHLCSLKERR
ncbi:hypothetical protein CSPX01_13108 [Colletotrichum filicis]|nr:hypothetical protein CSPX01_13108 [Colletotrichum filicis]